MRDLDPTSQRNFLNLLKAAERFPITLLIGSGVSASAGLPIWVEFLRRITAYFLCHWKITLYNRRKKLLRPPSNISIALTADAFVTPSINKVVKELLHGDATVLAQQVKNCIRPVDWRYLLRKALYTCDFDTYIDTSKSLLLDAIASLCAASSVVKSVINYNYDNVLQLYLGKHSVRYKLILDGGELRDRVSLHIFHPHGYLSRDGGPITSLILSEEEYHEESFRPYSWGNIAQLKHMTSSCCVFIGASMVDPNMRRLLRAAKPTSISSHFAFLPSDEKPSDIQWMTNALFDEDLHKLNVSVIRFLRSKRKKDPFCRLPSLISIMAKHAADRSAVWEK